MKEEVVHTTTSYPSTTAYTSVAPNYIRRISWGAIFAGLIVTLVCQILLTMLGVAIGAATIEPIQEQKPLEGLGTGAALWWITPFTPATAALMSAVIVLMGFLGGLVMSAIKRDRGVKDWGALIEGHGGVLDRLDSVCFSAPIFFHLVRYGWTA